MYTNTTLGSMTLLNKPANGPAYESVVSLGTVEVYRSDTVSRRKPFDLFSNNTTAFSQTQQDRRTSISRSYPDGSLREIAVSALFSSSVDRSALKSRATTIAENRLRATAKASAANLGQMVAEYRQTCNMFGQLSARAFHVYQNVKKRRFRNVVSSRRNARDHLMYVYGIAPLTGDMADLTKALGSKKVPPIIVSSSATLRDSVRTEQSLLGRAYYGEHFCEARVRCKARATLNENLFRNSTLTHYGLSNPLALGWELVPFSFVCDWWINVGDVLSSLDNGLAFTQLSGYTTSRTYDHSLMLDAVLQYKWNQRTAKSYPLVNSFMLKPTPSVAHVLNGLALWRVMRRG